MHDSKNYQGRGLCYLPKPKAEADNMNRSLDNFTIMQKPNPITVLLCNKYCKSRGILNEAKCNLGKVKLETMQYRTSGVAHGICQGLPWLRLQLHFTLGDLCGSFAIVLWQIIADSRSCCIMNH